MYTECDVKLNIVGYSDVDTLSVLRHPAVNIIKIGQIPAYNLDGGYLYVMEMYSYFAMRYRDTSQILGKLRDFRKKFYDVTGIYLVLADNESRMLNELKKKSKFVLDFEHQNNGTYIISSDLLDQFTEAVSELNDFYLDYVGYENHPVINQKSLDHIHGMSSRDKELLDIYYDHILSDTKESYISGNVETVYECNYLTDDDREREREKLYYNYFKRLGEPDRDYKNKLALANILTSDNVEYDIRVNRVVYMDENNKVINTTSKLIKYMGW